MENDQKILLKEKAKKIKAIKFTVLALLLFLAVAGFAYVIMTWLYL